MLQGCTVLNPKNTAPRNLNSKTLVIERTGAKLLTCINPISQWVLSTYITIMIWETFPHNST